MTTAKLPGQTGGRRPGTPPVGPRRPGEAPRPKRRATTGSPDAAESDPCSSAIRLSCPTFVELTAEQELLATSALAELLVPLLAAGVTPVVDT